MRAEARLKLPSDIIKETGYAEMNVCRVVAELDATGEVERYWYASLAKCFVLTEKS